MEKKYTYSYNGQGSSRRLSEHEMIQHIQRMVKDPSVEMENYSIFELVPVEMKEVKKISLERK